MKSDFTRFREIRKFGSLDGLRALSILGVIWFHSWWGTPYYPLLVKIPIIRLGEMGIHVFFVISGFLITTLLFRERRQKGEVSLSNFYVRRALRIWPLYYATIAIYIVIMLFFDKGPGRASTFFHYLPGFLTYTYTWCITPNWPTGPFNLASTLATEEQFYVFWPLVLRFLRGTWAVIFMIALVLLRLAAGYGWTSRILPYGSLAARIVLSVAIAICMGVLLAYVLDSEFSFRLLFRVFGRRWSAPVALVLLAICLIPRYPNLLISSLAIATLVASCVVREDNGLAPFLKWRPVALVGTWSYGMYLFTSLCVHAAMITLRQVGIVHPLFVFPASFGLTTMAAYLSYQYFETPFLKLKSRFSQESALSASPRKQNPRVASLTSDLQTDR
jgi:peptidoglycan/LPS O-acetylase OafA/YrhL